MKIYLLTFLILNTFNQMAYGSLSCIGNETKFVYFDATEEEAKNNQYIIYLTKLNPKTILLAHYPPQGNFEVKTFEVYRKSNEDDPDLKDTFLNEDKKIRLSIFCSKGLAIQETIGYPAFVYSLNKK